MVSKAGKFGLLADMEELTELLDGYFGVFFEVSAQMNDMFAKLMGQNPEDV